MHPDVLKVLINGEQREIPAGSTLPDVLRSLQIDPLHGRGIAVAVNDEVVRRANWQGVALAPGDRVEVITATQGG